MEGLASEAGEIFTVACAGHAPVFVALLGEGRPNTIRRHGIGGRAQSWVFEGLDETKPPTLTLTHTLSLLSVFLYP